jgi:hypothetical protein
MPSPGRFLYVPVLDRWTWDDTVFDLHGLPAEHGTPTTDRLLEAVHPDDHERVTAFLELAGGDTGGPGVSTYVVYRVVSHSGPRRLAAVGQATDCAPAGLAGFFVDVTVTLKSFRDHAAQRAIDAHAAGEARVQQAVGQVMLAYAVRADAARTLLETWAAEHGAPLAEVADRLVARARRGDFSDPRLRSRFDDMLHDATCTPDHDRARGSRR